MGKMTSELRLVYDAVFRKRVQDRERSRIEKYGFKLGKIRHF